MGHAQSAIQSRETRCRFRKGYHHLRRSAVADHSGPRTFRGGRALCFQLKLIRCPRFDSCAPAHFDLSVCPSMLLASPRLHSRSYPRHFYVDHSHCIVLAPATLAGLPSTRAIETRSLPALARFYPCSFTFYV